LASASAPEPQSEGTEAPKEEEQEKKKKKQKDDQDPTLRMTASPVGFEHYPAPQDGKRPLKSNAPRQRSVLSGTTDPSSIFDKMKEMRKQFVAANDELKKALNAAGYGDDGDDVDGDAKKEKKKEKKQKKKKGAWYAEAMRALTSAGLLLLSVGALASVTRTSADDVFGRVEITLQDFVRDVLPSGRVDRIVVTNKTRADVYVKGESGSSRKAYTFSIVGGVEQMEREIERAEIELGIDVYRSAPVVYAESSKLSTALDFGHMLLLLGIIALISGRMARGMMGDRNPFSMGKHKARMFKPQDVKVRFKDVAGLEEAKQEIVEFVEFLKSPARFLALGAKIPRGALLTGPPGTGKTLLAKATAGEASVPFFSISGTDFLEMFVGVGPARVRDLFAKARAAAPCILFIDEIDAIGRARGKSGFRGGNDERENTLNQMLVEMDGFETGSGVVVLASTNRADILDPALLRPGRFDRQVNIDLPDIAAREEIFRVHLKPLKLDSATTFDGYAHRLAALTPGMSGADIANVCNEAALIAARCAGQDNVTLVDFEAAVERVIGGLERKSRVLSKDERTTVAHHEAGHAIAGWYLEHSNPLLKVSIVPRGEAALGYAQYLPRDQYLYTENQLADMMCMTLSGRAAEQLCFEKISTGAQDDLDKVTKIAYAHAAKYGMNPNIGPLSFPQRGEPGAGYTRHYSEETAEEIDNEVRRQVSASYQRALDLLRDKMVDLRRLAALLLEREVLKREDLIEVLGPRPFDDEPDRALDFYESTNRRVDEQQQDDASGAADGAKVDK
jgi:AFG3 family protein